MSNEFEQGQEQTHEQVTIAFDGEDDVVCDVIGVLEVEGQEYIALIPAEGEDDGVMIFRYIESAEGTELGEIESEEEYNRVVDAYDKALQEAFESANFDDFEDETDL
jgi:hypothetical protein